MTYKKPELLIPASSLEVLRTAVMFGADAVYIGGEAFGVKFYANGAMIIKLESYYDGEKYVCPAKDAKNRQTTGQMRFAVSGYKTGNRRPSFCIPWGIFGRTGVFAWQGITSSRAGGR